MMAPRIPAPRSRIRPLLLALVALTLTPLAADPSDPDYDPLEDDSLWDDPVSPEDTQTTSPTLQFLSTAPDQTPHHHQNQITLSASSLEDGWAELRQCHLDVAPIRRMVVVYNQESIADLEVESSRNIESARAEGHRVDLRGVSEDAEVCITGRMQVVEAEGNGVYRLENGPFVRRFLDGYFPMRVILAINWGDLDLRFEDSEPAEQDGFNVRATEHGVLFDTLFEGELRTQVRLRQIDPR